MRRILLILLLVLIPPVLVAQENHPAPDAAHAGARAEESHAEEHEAPKTYFGMPGWLLKLVNMLAFLGLLGYLLKGPIAKAFADRSEQIRREAEEARERREKADRMAADIQERLTHIEAEVQAIHERAVAEGERQKRELIAAAETEAQKILTAARNEVDSRLKYARKELTEYAGQLASERAEQILRERITESDQKKLFAESLREVDEVRS